MSRPTDFLGGALLGVSHIVIKSSGFPGRCLQSWEKQVFLLPTYLITQEKTILCFGCTGRYTTQIGLDCGAEVFAKEL